MKKQSCSHTTEDVPFPQAGRRKFLQLAALGSGMGLFSVVSGISEVRAEKKAGTLLLSCMDYRLMDEIERYMLRRGLYHNYDHIILAGASLGAVTDKYPAWSRTFWDHLDLAVKLHEIQTVMVMDHRDCGAYKVLLGEDYSKNTNRETAEHTVKLIQLKGMINKKHPEIEVETLLMGLNGEVEVIPTAVAKQEG